MCLWTTYFCKNYGTNHQNDKQKLKKSKTEIKMIKKSIVDDWRTLINIVMKKLTINTSMLQLIESSYQFARFSSFHQKRVETVFNTSKLSRCRIRQIFDSLFSLTSDLGFSEISKLVIFTPAFEFKKRVFQKLHFRFSARLVTCFFFLCFYRWFWFCYAMTFAIIVCRFNYFHERFRF